MSLDHLVSAIDVEMARLQQAHILDGGVLRCALVPGRAEGPCAADGLEVRAAAAGTGAGHDGGVQREAGPEEMVHDLLPGRDRARQS
jgi:hypothetical protein